MNPVSPIDSGIGNDEYQAAGLGGQGTGDLTENAYRADRARLGEDVPQRERYSPNPVFH